jgi:hypothetical protein
MGSNTQLASWAEILIELAKLGEKAVGSNAIEFHPAPGDRVLACREFGKEFEPAVILSRWPVASEFYEIRFESDGHTALKKPYRMRPIIDSDSTATSRHSSPLAVESAQ